MSRIIAVTLLLIILVDNFYDTTAARVSKVDIRKCRCRVLKSGKKICPHPLLPKNHVEEQDLIKCLCSKSIQHKFQTTCRSWRPNFPISMI